MTTIDFIWQAGVNGFRILSGDHIPSGGQVSHKKNYFGSELIKYLK
jgi:hypothetical protein